MPDLTIVVTGTGTEVGKTWVAARLARGLRELGIAVAARKPVESFAPNETETDAEVLAGATGEPAVVVCPPHRRYPVPMAPPMAAEVLGRERFTISDLVEELEPAEAAVLVVEGAGGPRSPLAADGDTVAIADALDADLYVLVAESGLGAINAVLCCAAPLAPRPVTVYLNRYDAADDVHRRTATWLSDKEGMEVFFDVRSLAERVAGATAMRSLTVETT